MPFPNRKTAVGFLSIAVDIDRLPIDINVLVDMALLQNENTPLHIWLKERHHAKCKEIQRPHHIGIDAQP